MPSLKSLFGLIFAKTIVRKNNFWKKNAIFSQRSIFKSLVKKAADTNFGLDHNFSKIESYGEWKKNIPIRGYEDLEKYIELVKSGKENILWPGKPIYFCKTSGTTSGIKYIPISKESMPFHIKSARDAMLTYIAETNNSSIINGKMIFIQGSPALTKTGGVLTGRLSGIVAHHIPFYLKKNRLPSFEVNCIENWEEKVDAIVEETVHKNMSVIGGIPPWVQMYFEKIKKKTGEQIKTVFPSFNLFMYGGVNFNPYKKTFENLIGSKVDGVELYPSSEGFIAYQDSQYEEGMLLCVNHGIFYEFIPSSEFFDESPNRISLEDVKINVDYVIILNTNAGLWGYNIGDTVKFVSINPYRLIVTGRIKHFTSAFGEHVIAEEVERSLNESVSSFSFLINEFHVAPQVDPEKGLPFHEWFVEFENPPGDLNAFSNLLDVNLQKLNIYYKDLVGGKVLSPLKITKIRKGGFRNYMKSIGKLGGQNKVPRLANDRKVADELKKFQDYGD